MFYIWRTVWAQSDESLWGLVEKYKLINALTGKGFYYFFCNDKNSVLSENENGQSSLLKIEKLSIEKLKKFFGIDFSTYTEDFISKINLFNSNIPHTNSELYFCKECIAEGFHSIYHQMPFLEYCPYHLDEKLTNICPNCKEIFRFFNVGYKEEAFCCKNCHHNVLGTKNILYLIKRWKINKIPIDSIIKKLNLPLEQQLYFVGLREYNYVDTNASYRSSIRLLENCCSVNNHPKIYDNTDKDLYIHKTPKHLSFKLLYSGKYFRTELDLMLYNMSKSIFKSVERYILKQLDKKTRYQIKKAYDQKGYDSASKIKNPFIEWRNECYGDWLTHWRNECYGDRLTHSEHYPTFASTYYYHLIPSFPRIVGERKFKNDMNNLLKLANTANAFSILYNKMIFFYLYNRYLEWENIFNQKAIYNITPGIILKKDDIIIFICKLPKIKCKKNQD